MKKTKKNQIDWRNHLVGLIVVILGISIAFMLENWKQSRSDRALEITYLKNFSDNLMQDALELDSIINAVQVKSYLLGSYLNDLQRGQISQDKAQHVLYELMQNHHFVPVQVTYESLKSSGNMNIVSDEDLKSVLVAYYIMYDELKLKEDVFFDYLQAFIFPFVYKHMDFASGQIMNMSHIQGIEFKNIVIGYYTLVNQNLEAYKKYHEDNKKLLEKLNK